MSDEPAITTNGRLNAIEDRLDAIACNVEFAERTANDAKIRADGVETLVMLLGIVSLGYVAYRAARSLAPLMELLAQGNGNAS